MNWKLIGMGLLATSLQITADNVLPDSVPAYPYTAVPLRQVQITDGFWQPRLRTNRAVTIPHAFQECEKSGRIENFKVAAGKSSQAFQGNQYDDSDVFKVIEAASYALQQEYDPKLDAYLDALIATIAGAQEQDGYLYTARTCNPQKPHVGAGPERWTASSWSHELYNAGHLYEAAVAHYAATQKRSLLEVAIKNADLVCATFGPGKLRYVPGHEEVELALVRMAQITGKAKYLELAKFFVAERGHANGRQLYVCGEDLEYHQDNLPLLQQTKAVGHAVRAAYLYAGAVDVAALTQDAAYTRAVSGIWSNVVGSKLYLTGGIGARHDHEAFGADYELPNDVAHTETCASVANMLWNQRMFQLTGESRYIDVLERVLFNGFLSGVALSGDRFFYCNPLASKGDQRSAWFGTACCPPNVARFLASLPAYLYAQRQDQLYVNLYAGSQVEFTINERQVVLKQETDYPWNGQVRLAIQTPAPSKFQLRLRIPGWAVNQPVPSDLYAYEDQVSPAAVEIQVNGKPVKHKISNGYAVIKRKWRNQDAVTLTLPMPVRRVVANGKVAADRGMEAYERGPLVYCFEGKDNSGNLLGSFVTDKANIQYEYNPTVLNGIGRLHFHGQQIPSESSSGTAEGKAAELAAIPYFAWANRGNSSMAVWMKQNSIGRAK